MQKVFSKLLITLTMLSLLTLSSCNKTDNSDSSDWKTVSNKRMKVVSDSKGLSTRIIFNASSATQPAQTSAKVIISDDARAAGFFEFAKLNPLVLDNGDLLSATSIQTYGQYAIVTYHNHYKALGGGLELLDISDPANPMVLSSLIYLDRDFNHIAFDNSDLSNSKFWILGDDSKKGLAYIIEGQIVNGKIQSSLKEKRLPGSSANCAELIGGNLVVATTGVKETNSGVFEMINMQSGDAIQSKTVKRGKHIASDPNSASDAFIAFEITENGNAILSYYDEETQIFANPKWTYDFGKLQVVDGKNTIRLYDNKAYVALSDKGFAVLDVETGSILNSVANGAKGIVNGIDVDSRYIYVANGSAGTKVYDKASCDYLFTFGNVEGIANYTKANDGQKLLFVANGIEGVSIICTDGCETDPICTFFLEEVYTNLPENMSVFASSNPDVQAIFADGDEMPKCIEATAATSIFINYIQEKSGFTNSLGYFIIPNGENVESYFTNVIKPNLFLGDGLTINPEYIIFKSVSDQSEGGDLAKGETFVRINGLNQGDKVYFFLVPDGFADGEAVKLHHMYQAAHMPRYSLITTEPSVNEFEDNNRPLIASFSKLMHVMFNSEDCKSFVLMFEDNYGNIWADSDYNDCIFSVTDNRLGEPLTKIKMSK